MNCLVANATELINKNIGLAASFFDFEGWDSPGLPSEAGSKEARPSPENMMNLSVSGKPRG